jgi:hypothetical protein
VHTAFHKFTATTGNSGYVSVTPAMPMRRRHRRRWPPAAHRPTHVMVGRNGRGDACVALVHPGTNQGMRDECGTNAGPPIPPMCPTAIRGHRIPAPIRHRPTSRATRATHASPLPVYRSGQTIDPVGRYPVATGALPRGGPRCPLSNAPRYVSGRAPRPARRRLADHAHFEYCRAKQPVH